MYLKRIWPIRLLSYLIWSREIVSRGEILGETLQFRRKDKGKGEAGEGAKLLRLQGVGEKLQQEAGGE